MSNNKTEILETFTVADQNEVRNQILQFLQVVKHEHLAKQIGIQWSTRMTRKMGEATEFENPNSCPLKTKYLLKFSIIFWVHATPEERKETVIHEMAHVLCFHLYPNMKIYHGAEWLEIMGKFGYKDASKYTTVKIPEKFQPKRFSVKCGCREHQVTIKIINQMKKGITYRCSVCKGLIVFKE